MNAIFIPVSIGELIDKITILEIKLIEIVDKEKLASVKKEHSLLMNILEEQNISLKDEYISEIVYELSDCNKVIWDTENEMRFWEQKGIYEKEFIGAARRAYHKNYRRYLLKQQINKFYNSDILEEKQYL